MQHDLHNTYIPFCEFDGGGEDDAACICKWKSAMLYDLNNIFEDRDDRPLFI